MYDILKGNQSVVESFTSFDNGLQTYAASFKMSQDKKLSIKISFSVSFKFSCKPSVFDKVSNYLIRL